MELKKCEDVSGQTVWINTEHVEYIYLVDETVTIYLVSGHAIALLAKGNPFTDADPGKWGSSRARG